MKRVVSREELREKMCEAINMLCDTIKTTLGPKGSNVIIDHSTFSPFITNDGVTIAENIESDDVVINTILEIAKEASINTNEKVGDGTTTTLVLLQSLFNNGLKLIKNGKNPIILKRELDEILPLLINKINEKSVKPTKRDIYNIAYISANSKVIGKNITDAFLTVKNSNAINIKVGNEIEDKVILKKGYSIDTLIGSVYFFKDKNTIELNDVYILLINNYLNNLEDIANILNHVIAENKKLVIIAEDYSEMFVNQSISLFLNDNVNLYLLKTPEYGKNKIDTLSDLALISNAKIVEDLSYLNETVLGKISKLTINKEETTFQFLSDIKIKNKITELKKLLGGNDIDKSFINKRVAMLQKGIIEILVGASTETERRERKMRYDDALCALAAIDKGIVPGGGIVLYEIAESLKLDNDTNKLLTSALKEPFNQIMYNSGVDKDKVINKVKENYFKIIYNVNKDDFEKIDETEVIDPTYVLVHTLTNAISIAGMLLTTTSLVINEHENNLNKISTYTEL